MYKAYKTEIKPNEKQKRLIHQTIGTCRYVYNLYLEKNIEAYKKEEPFISGYDFSKWLNNIYVKDDQYKWIKEASSKSVKQAILNGDIAYRKFFKKLNGYPNFKKKSDYGSFYCFGMIHVQRHLIQLPKLGKIKLKEKGYLPSENIKSATLSKESDRYFISVLVKEEKEVKMKPPTTDGIGIDLELKEMAYLSNGEIFLNISKINKIERLQKSLKRQLRKLSRRKAGSENYKKQKIIIQRLHRRIKNIKNDYKRNTVLEIVKRNPKYITIEHLKVQEMMKNRRLSNAFQQIGISYFTEWLRQKCIEYDIELRRVDTYYPSSQICSSCGNKKKMPLSERVYNCTNCGEVIDRDLNAAINLKQAKEYTLLVL